MLDRLLLGLDVAEQVGGADMQAARRRRCGCRSPNSTQTMPKSLTVASAQLRGQPETASFTLAGVHEPHRKRSSLTPSPVEILGAEAAPVAADAGLHRAQALGIGLARDHAGGVEVGPHRGQVLLAHAEQVDALAAGDLDGRDLELVGHVGDRAQLVRAWSSPPHMRGTTEKVPSFWMLACTRSLTKRDCASSGTRRARRRAGSSSAPAGRSGSRTRSSSRAPATPPACAFSSFATISRRTSSCVRSMHLHIGLRARGGIGVAQRRAPAAPRPWRCTGRRKRRPWSGRARRRASSGPWRRWRRRSRPCTRRCSRRSRRRPTGRRRRRSGPSTPPPW